MLERARNLGGEIVFDGNPGKGTTIVVTLPLESADMAADVEPGTKTINTPPSPAQQTTGSKHP